MIYVILNLASSFSIKKIGNSFHLKSKKDKLKFLLYYLFGFAITSYFFFRIMGDLGLQVINFLFSFLLIFEICMKISDSERFLNWIGDNLEKPIRQLIMFVIALNCTYFFTRITQQIIESQNL